MCSCLIVMQKIIVLQFDHILVFVFLGYFVNIFGVLKHMSLLEVLHPISGAPDPPIILGNIVSRNLN